MFAVGAMASMQASAADLWVSYPGNPEGNLPGKGKKIVLIAGDEEYRSEEALPQIAQILAKHHGFDTTVLFSIDPATGEISPNEQKNIPGTEKLNEADLMIIATRFRNLPDEQMKPIVDFIESGKPIIGLRTATHAFNLNQGSYQHLTWNREGGGFGRQILGETWVAHHGHHGVESTRGVIHEEAKNHPIVRGAGDIWGPTDVYTTNPPEDAKVLVWGKVLKGMNPGDEGVDKKNDPMQALAWIREQKVGEKTRRVFTTTMGSSTDFESEGLRRLVVNATYWGVGLEDKISENANVELVGEYKPSRFAFNGGKKGVKPSDLAWPK